VCHADIIRYSLWYSKETFDDVQNDEHEPVESCVEPLDFNLCENAEVTKGRDELVDWIKDRDKNALDSLDLILECLQDN